MLDAKGRDNKRQREVESTGYTFETSQRIKTTKGTRGSNVTRETNEKLQVQ